MAKKQRPNQHPTRIVVERHWNKDGIAKYRAYMEGEPDTFEEGESRFAAIGAFVAWFGTTFDVDVLPTTDFKTEE